MNHNDYIFSTEGDQFRFLRRFEDMYKNCEDPHGQSTELLRVDYQLVSTLLGRVISSIEADKRRVKVLDVGCGLGYFTAHIKKLFPSAGVFGCDISTSAIEKAQVRAPQCDFFPIDLKERVQLSGESYSVLVALDVLYYFTEQEILGVVNNLYRLLDDQGFLLVGYHLPKKMSFGRYIQNLMDAKALFESNGFTFRFTMDVVNNLDSNYAGESLGRHIYFLAQKVTAK